MSIEYRYKNGHVEVYVNGVFLLSADSMSEARKEVKETLNAA